jgi:hypothetical protein
VACCGTEIAYDQVKHKLPPHVRLLFAAAFEEYSTPAAQRLYCAQGCGVFLGQVADSQVVQCTSCDEFTCAACRGVKHDGPCKIEDNNVMADLARAQNWQKCGGCKAMVELSYGCNHITLVHRFSRLACLDANSCIGADAVLNSATNAEQSGKLAHARSGPAQTCASSLPLRRMANPSLVSASGTTGTLCQVVAVATHVVDAVISIDAVIARQSPAANAATELATTASGGHERAMPADPSSHLVTTPVRTYPGNWLLSRNAQC